MDVVLESGGRKKFDKLGNKLKEFVQFVTLRFNLLGKFIWSYEAELLWFF